MIESLFAICIRLYWLTEGVTEGYTWASHTRRITNKLIHPNNKSNGLMDYHGWRIFENICIWGSVIIASFLNISLKSFFLIGTGAWLIGTFCYECALNYVDTGTIYKPTNYKCYVLGYNIPWISGKSLWILFIAGLIVLIIGYVK